MTRETIPGLCALLFVLSACGGTEAPAREWTPADHGQPAEGEPSAAQEPSAQAASAEDPTARAARALWNATCAGCHGRDGRGHGDAPPPGAQLPDFALATWQSSRTDLQLVQAVRDGRGMMPAFGKQVNEQGIAALMQHIRGFGADSGAAPAPMQTPEAATHGATEN